MPSTLLSLLSEASDHRRGQGKVYGLAPILLFTVLAMLAGGVSYRQVHAFIDSGWAEAALAVTTPRFAPSG